LTHPCVKLLENDVTAENTDSRTYTSFSTFGLRGNDKPAMIDSSRSLNLSCFFVIVGLDPTIQKIKL
jgi:hypothetical protein